MSKVKLVLSSGYFEGFAFELAVSSRTTQGLVLIERATGGRRQ
jgi:hypothetical protein